MKNFVVCFKTRSGKIAISHYCTKNEVVFWENEGYFVKSVNSHLFW